MESHDHFDFEIIELQAPKKKRTRSRKQQQPWSKEECVQLVMAVEPFENIWNHTIADYKNREKREFCWDNIVKDVGRRKEDCKNKWSCLRVNYKTTIVKMMQTTSGQEAIENKRLPDPYQAMAFLDPMLNIEPSLPRVSNVRHLSKMDEEGIIKLEPDIQSDNTLEDETYTPKSAKRKRIQIRPKVVEAWNDESIVNLINEVEIRPCIWNAGDKEYKSRYKRDSAWKEISAVFDHTIDAEQLTAKWQALRCQYRNVFSNAKKTNSGHCVSNKPHWKFYSQMSFVGAAEKEQRVSLESNVSNSEDNEDTQTTASDSTTPNGSGIAQRQRKTWGATAIGVDDVTDKKEMGEMKARSIDRLQQPTQPTEDVQVFGNYLISNLMQIKDVKYRETTQRRLLQLLWECIDKEPYLHYKIKTIEKQKPVH